MPVFISLFPSRKDWFDIFTLILCKHRHQEILENSYAKFYICNIPEENLIYSPDYIFALKLEKGLNG